MTKKGGTWKCPYNCDLEKRARPCRHLEALLGPVLGEDARRVVYSKDIERQATSPTAEDLLIQNEEDERLEYLGFFQDSEEEALRVKLRTFGLSVRRTEVLIDRILHGKTFKEIAQDRGYSRPQGARQSFEDAKAFLAKKGFKK